MQYFRVKHCSLIIFILCLCWQDAYAEDDLITLDWCFDNINGSHQMLGSPPHPSGPSVELMHYLAEQVGFTLNYIAPTPTLRCFKLLAKGEVDIMTNLAYSPRLAETVNYYKYLDSVNSIKLVLLADDERTIDSVDSLIDSRVVVVLVRGYYYGEAIFKLTRNNRFSNVFVNSAEDALNMLKIKRADVALLPSSNVLNIENENHEAHLFKHIDLPPELKQLGAIHIGLSKNSQYAYLGPKIEEALSKARQSGLIERLRHKWQTIDK